MRYAWAGVALIAFYVVMRLTMEARRARRLRAARRRFIVPGSPRLTPGDTTLAGVVETDAPEGLAIRLAAPYGRFVLASKGELRWRIAADEWDLSGEAHPFTLVADGSGARVRVWPEEDVNLLSWPESAGVQKGPVLHPSFALSLRAGERVLVSGTLAASASSASAYRAEEHAFVLKPPRGGSLVIETETFALQRDRSRRSHRRIGDAIFTGIAVVHLVLVGICLSLADEGPPPSPLADALFASVVMMGLVIVGWAVSALPVRGNAPKMP